MPHITHILLRWTVFVLLPNQKQFVWWTVCFISQTPWSGWPSLLHSLIAHNSSEQTVCRILHTHWYGCPFLLFYLIANSSNRLTVCPASHTHCYGCPFLLFCLIADSLNGLTVCPSSHTQLKLEPFLMHTSSEMFCTILTFLHHRLRLLHHTYFRQRVSNHSVALAVSCSGDTPLSSNLLGSVEP